MNRFLVSKLDAATQKKVAAKVKESVAALGGQACTDRTGYSSGYLSNIARGLKAPSLGFATRCSKALPEWDLDELVGASLAAMGRRALQTRLLEDEKGARVVRPATPAARTIAVPTPTSAVVSPSEYKALMAQLEAVMEENRKLKDYVIKGILT